MSGLTRSLFSRSCSLHSASLKNSSRLPIASSSRFANFCSSTSAQAEDSSNSNNAVNPTVTPTTAATAGASIDTTATASAAPGSTATLDDILGSAQAQPQDEQQEASSSSSATTQQQQRSPSSASPSVRINDRQGRSASSGQSSYHRLHIKTSRNNTILTFTTPDGNPLAAATGGTAGFKKSQRSGYEAGYRAAFQMFDHISEYRKTTFGAGIGAPRSSHAARMSGGLVSLPMKSQDLTIETIWSGFGQGREAVFRALMTNEGQNVRSLVKRVTDATPLKIGGVRPKKRRML
ncbi:hypothetical protein OC845_004568 [Tilletia horrida]|nr:hypothetical protein OC845_004568 [Tilletia horrida]